MKQFKQEKAVIVGHDWGGLVAWTFAMTYTAGHQVDGLKRRHGNDRRQGIGKQVGPGALPLGQEWRRPNLSCDFPSP